MQDPVKYIGCFFDPAELEEKLQALERKPLFRAIPAPHITFVYRPEAIPAELFGLPVKVEAVGYGNDGENEALQVAFAELPEALRPLGDSIPVPHITLSVAENGESVNSGFLTFKPIVPFMLTATFGAMHDSGKIQV